MRTPWQRPRAAWMTLTGTGAAASVAFGLLVFASVLASLAIPRESTGLRTDALRHVVAAAPLGDQAVIGTIGLTDLPVTAAGQSAAPEMAAIGARLRSRAAAAGLPIASDPPAWSGLTSGYAPVTGAARAAGRGQPQFEVAYRTALARYSHTVAGHLPSGGTVRAGGRGASRSDHRHRGQAGPAGRRPPEHGADGAAGDHGDHPAGTPGFGLLDR